MGRPKAALIFRTLVEKGGKLVRSKPNKNKSTSKPTEVKILERESSSGSRAPKIARVQSPDSIPSGNTADNEPSCAHDSCEIPAEDEWGFEESGFAAPPPPDYAPTSSNTYLNRWREKYSLSYLSALFSLDAAPDSLSCKTCTTDASTLYRCQDCLISVPQCSQCIVSTHRVNPTHAIRAWTGRMWREAALSELKLVIYLGHNGAPCPRTTQDTELLIGDLTGFSSLTVRFCGCNESSDKPKPRGLQLLPLGILSCSDETPQSGFTLRVLRHFGIFSTLAKGSAHKYYAMLERQTQPGFPGLVTNRARELLATHRRFSYLLALKRSGTTFPQHPNPAFEDSLIIKCPACPNPGINFNMVEVPPDEIPLVRYWISLDGNFKNARKAKVFSSDDVCFTVGNMYFVDQNLYKEWLKSREAGEDSGSKQKKDRPECDNHKAAQDKFVGLRGLDVTGVGALTCTRHTFFLPNGVVDFYNGERFVYSDYAFASVILYLLRHGNLPIGMTYDIWCHWIPNLKKRLEKLPENLTLPANLDLVGGVPKFHLQGHANVCWVRYSLNNMEFVGRIEGEGVERAWAYLNETAGSTCEKSPGARWDSINLILSDWNFDKMVRMVSYLVGKFQEAVKMFHWLMEVFLELDESLPTHLTKAWRDTPTEPTEVSPGKWSSPYQAAEYAGEGFQEVIRRERANEEELGLDSSQQIGVTKWVSSGIELEYSMELVRLEVKKAGTNATAGKDNYINDRRKQLHDRIVSHRNKRSMFMGDIGEPDHPDLQKASSPNPEHAIVGLPSTYTLHTKPGSASTSLSKLEIELRRAVCNDALESLKNLLGAKILALKYKKENVSGVRAVTRALTALREHEEKVSRMKWKYNNSRSALLRLSNEQSDVDTYRYLEDKDVKQLTHYIEDRTRSVGQKDMEIPWIWRTRAGATKEGWQAEALQTEWFRARRRYKQWEEELKLLKREMVMTIRQFGAYSEIWDYKARCDGLEPGMVEYAARKSEFFTKLQDDALRQCLPLIKDPIVDMRWASDWVSTFEAAKSQSKGES